MRAFTALGISLAEASLVPDPILRWGIRRICASRLRADVPAGEAAQAATTAAFVRRLGTGPIAHVPDLANAQHYEVPPRFFELVLGERLKYSCCLYDAPDLSLDEAEERALAATMERADLADGQDILELGCGWGSLTLSMAARFPGSQILAVSNSAPQRAHIEGRAAARGLTNVVVITADMNDFAPPSGHRFDRVVSVEMFEHMRNYEVLLGRVRDWLRPDGRLFTHVFCHRTVPYFFEDEREDDWMARNFFSGGIMPCEDLFTRFPDTFTPVGRWSWDGTHYARTADHWLANLDARRDEVRASLLPTYGADTERWIQRWRMFFLAVSEMFGYADGSEWGVVHTLLAPAPR